MKNDFINVLDLARERLSDFIYVYTYTHTINGKSKKKEQRKKEQNIHEIWDNYQKVLHMCNGTTRRRREREKETEKNVHNDSLRFSPN